MKQWGPPYLFVQGSLVLGWWALLLTHVESRAWFFPLGEMTVELRALLMPDGLVLGVGSLCGAWGLLTRRPWARSVAWLVAGAASYAALFTLHWSLLAAAPALSPVLMTLVAAGSVSCARHAV